MEELISKGFETSQINQLIKIKELGVDILKEITPEIDTEILRNIRTFISNEKYDVKQKKVISKFYIKKNYNVTKFIDAGISSQDNMNLLIKMEQEGFSIEDFIDSKLNYKNLKIIYSFLKSGNFNVKKYILKGYDETKINLAILLETVGLSLEELEEKGYVNMNKQELIYQFYKKDIKILDMINAKFSNKQIKALLEISDLNIDLKKIINEEYTAATMKILGKALAKGYDIQSYFKENKTSNMAQAIFTALENSIDPNLFTSINNNILLTTTLNLLNLKIDVKQDLSKVPEQNLKIFNKMINKRELEKFNLDVLLNPLLSEIQLTALIDCMKKSKKIEKLDFTILSNTSFSYNQILTIANCMEKDIDYEMLTLPNLTNRQINSLMNVIPKCNLKGLIDEKTQPNVIEAISLLISSGYEIKKKA